jgi:hypothetical protein
MIVLADMVTGDDRNDDEIKNTEVVVLYSTCKGPRVTVASAAT